MADSVDVSKGLPANPEKATLDGKNKFLGMFVFLAGETTMFATFFGTYLGLRSGTADGPVAADIFQLPLVFIMTMILLTSSLTSVLATFAMKKNQFGKLKFWMWMTFLLGATFLGLEIYEFVEYYEHGLGYTTSAFASSFYTLVGLHGAHVLFGLGWILLLLLRNRKAGITLTNAPKFYAFSLYWHFIDVVWVFIFTVVYLMGIGG
ncbi:cytochrome (ubi)quinol oxidase subunit III [Salicibibacter halophilus]|uniref:Cytochrome (Ubi)quinol oxidase subunit III n=1 Tax=Salicibibacter halophilus TaxID=2502791 RepID=A0A514LGG6_9BACI|nr:cytochrome c oxidase subunit 3 [Salicibibacter halophilus]QDI90635.1 cytochrome (ubi)quinol oxidase subunit III [Salicibibacter halophilus]